MPPAKKIPAKKLAAAKKAPAPAPVVPAPVVSAPLLSLGAITSPLLRTGLQGITGGFIVQGLEVFGIASFTIDQRGWLVVALTTFVAGVQNWVEKWQGRKLIGATVQK